MNTKICFKCSKEKEIMLFYKHPKNADGHLNKCKICTKLDVKNGYHKNLSVSRERNINRHRYSIERLLLSRYYGIKTRCTKNLANGRSYIVKGKNFMTKQEWLLWCYHEDNYKKFMTLYNVWVQNNFERKLSPSIDRINHDESYIEGNLQWITTSENSIKGNKERKL